MWRSDRRTGRGRKAVLPAALSLGVALAGCANPRPDSLDVRRSAHAPRPGPPLIQHSDLNPSTVWARSRAITPLPIQRCECRLEVDHAESART